ncbi:MAG: 3-phosphoshikimate 1-carboxyvinyltransferase, partial [Phycisphaerae bacterium]
MILKSTKAELSGRVRIPGSKSHTIRAVAIASLAGGRSFIRQPLDSADAASSVRAYSMLGASIDTSNPDCWIVEGNGGRIAQPAGAIDVGNSGTTLRLAAGSAALGVEEAEFTGDHQISSRPIEPLLKSLTELGAKAYSVKGNGCAPIRVAGRLSGGRTEIECITSQYLSSLFMCCPLADGDTHIDVTLLNEPDYVGITLDWLRRQRIAFEASENLMSVDIKGRQNYKPFDAFVPSDFSSATFFLSAGAICGGEVVIEGLDYSDSQPDKAVADFLREMGADISIANDGTTTVRASELHGIDIDMNRTPDALPMMAVTAAFATGTTRLLNVAQARKKETDRIDCMARELSSLGADVEQLPDGLVIHGGRKLSAGNVCGHYDHRIVMALAVAGAALDGQMTID